MKESDGSVVIVKSPPQYKVFDLTDTGYMGDDGLYFVILTVDLHEYNRLWSLFGLLLSPFELTKFQSGSHPRELLNKIFNKDVKPFN